MYKNKYDALIGRVLAERSSPEKMASRNPDTEKKLIREMKQRAGAR